YGKGCALVKVEAMGGTFQARTVYSGNQLKTHFSSNVRVDGHIYGFDGNQNNSFLTCLDVKTGQERWKERGFDQGSILVGDRHLVVLSENGRLALIEPSPESYREKATWQVLQGQCWASPALAGTRLYVRNEKQLLCVDLSPTGN